jgi:hypothetical protein
MEENETAMLMSRCTKCRETKSYNAFSFKNVRVRSQCKKCAVLTSTESISRRKVRDLEGYNKAKARQKRSEVHRKLGININDFGEKQNWECGICKMSIKEKPYVDHCHTTKKVRGLLCFHCNVGIGHFRDSIEFLEKAIEYLKTYTDWAVPK